jgi:HSP20 family protein
MFSLIPRRKVERELTQKEGSPFGMMRREFASLLDRFFNPWPGFLAAPWEEVMDWGFNVEDTGKEVLIRAELPGFEAGEIDVAVADSLLTIRAERKMKEGEKEAEERPLARVERSVVLPASADIEKIEATYRNGVLEVRLPHKPEAMPRRVEVKT